jgi:hypothetical protein
MRLGGIGVRNRNLLGNIRDNMDIDVVSSLQTGLETQTALRSTTIPLERKDFGMHVICKSLSGGLWSIILLFSIPFLPARQRP